MVRERREKLVNQVSMGRMNLNNVESCLQRAPRGLEKRLNHGVNAALIERPWNCVLRGECQRTRGHRNPAALFDSHQSLACPRRAHAGFAAGMRKLNARAGSLRMDEAR